MSTEGTQYVKDRVRTNPDTTETDKKRIELELEKLDTYDKFIDERIGPVMLDPRIDTKTKIAIANVMGSTRVLAHHTYEGVVSSILGTPSINSWTPVSTSASAPPSPPMTVTEHYLWFTIDAPGLSDGKRKFTQTYYFNDKSTYRIRPSEYEAFQKDIFNRHSVSGSLTDEAFAVATYRIPLGKTTETNIPEFVQTVYKETLSNMTSMYGTHSLGERMFRLIVRDSNESEKSERLFLRDFKMRYPNSGFTFIVEPDGAMFIDVTWNTAGLDTKTAPLMYNTIMSILNSTLKP